ncbi:sigma-70 family RNA polymerase sigma factor [Anaerobutyricum hallii]|uniref:sigma-70 family RNA polymerase sigma factor n=1 Tax=Anaerobutyricum hallii TaxID=39488 RepID=UPI00399CF3A7
MEITRLVKRAKRKDADAFTELMESQMQNMYKVARSILSRDEDVADAISDTILVCWEKIDTLKKNRFFRTWMTRILINKCNDILRAGQRTVFTDEPLEIEYMENEFLNLEWILKGSDESQKFDINKEFGNTDVKLVSAEISALGLELISDYPKGCKYADMNGEHQPPSFAGVKMKDGKVYTYESVVDGSGEQFETGSSSKLYGKFTETVTTKKILEVKQIKALLFFKKSAGDSETYKAEDYYEIPLEVEK